MDVLFDHAYIIDPGHRLHASLGEQGFKLSDQVADYANHTSRFVFFERTGFPDVAPAYLEFLSPRIGERSSNEPVGLSLRVHGELEEFALTHQDLLLEYGAWLEHLSKESSAQSEDEAPGLNFLRFERHPIPGVFFWFTEYQEAVKSGSLASTTNEAKIVELSISSQGTMDQRLFRKLGIWLDGEEATTSDSVVLQTMVGAENPLLRAKFSTGGTLSLNREKAVMTT